MRKYFINISFSVEPSNKKIKKQEFYSTKKQNKKKKKEIAKPSESEKSTITSVLNIQCDHDYL